MHQTRAEDEEIRDRNRQHFRSRRQRYWNLAGELKLMSRIRFQHSPGLVAYVTCGDPNMNTTREIVLGAINAGADVIELGVPFSDPVADGPVIQRASERALRAGTTLAGVLSLVKSLREKTDVPLVLFSYFNPVLQMGLEKFCDAAS